MCVSHWGLSMLALPVQLILRSSASTALLAQRSCSCFFFLKHWRLSKQPRPLQDKFGPRSPPRSPPRSLPRLTCLANHEFAPPLFLPNLKSKRSKSERPFHTVSFCKVPSCFKTFILNTHASCVCLLYMLRPHGHCQYQTLVSTRNLVCFACCVPLGFVTVCVFCWFICCVSWGLHLAGCFLRTKTKCVPIGISKLVH